MKYVKHEKVKIKIIGFRLRENTIKFCKNTKNTKCKHIT